MPGLSDGSSSADPSVRRPFASTEASHSVPGSGVSRRGFLKGIALGAGAGAAGALPGEGVLGKALGALPAEAEKVGPGAVTIALNVNGKELRLKLEPRVTLLDALRDHMDLGKGGYVDLTGSKRVCDRSNCGACTVLVDGRAVYACSMLAIEAQGRKIQTIESLGSEDNLDPIQDAFVHCDGLMCGFCTPGFIVAAKALLAENPNPTREEILRGLDGNICRCGAQPRILEAVMLAASKKGRR